MNDTDKMKQNFEETIRNVVINHELPYENGAWETFQKNTVKPIPFYTTKWFMTLAIVAVLGTITLFVIESNYSQDGKKEMAVNESITKNHALVNHLDGTKNNHVGMERTINESQKEEFNTPTSTSEKIKSTKEKVSTETKETPEPKKINEENVTQKLPTTLSSPDSIIPEPETRTKANFYLPKSICSGETIYLTSEENKIAHSYEWQLNNGTTLNGSIQKYTPNTNGLELITLKITNSQGVVLAKQTRSIEIKKLPELTLEIENDELSIKNNYNFEATNSQNGSLTWDLGDGTKSNEKEVSHSFKKAGIYDITCNIISENGCAKSVTKKLEIPGIYNFRKDYGFSPNGDNINDLFIPIELTTLGVQFTMNIYARNGQLIYTTNTVQNPWNGRLADGTRSSFGSYVWVVTLTNEFGNQEVYKGTVTNVSN